MKFSHRATARGRIAQSLVLLLTLLVTVPASATAQESPFGETEFVSPKFGTIIEWTSDWELDTENSEIQVRRDVLGLIRGGGDDAVLIELQSQRTFRTGAQYINSAVETYSRLPEFEITEDNRDQSPASLVFTFHLAEFDVDVAGYVQSQPIEGATMVAIVLALPEDLERVKKGANDSITVNGVPLLEALPICGEAEEESTGTDESSSGSGDSKTSSKTGSKTGNKTGNKTGSSATPSGGTATCVEVFQSTGSDQPRPTPTPEPQESRGDSFNSETWTSDAFPGVSVRFDRTDWTVEEEFLAADNNGRDSILLFHADLPTYVVIEVYSGFNGRAGACIDVALGEAGISPGTDELLVDDDGNPIQGSQQGRVWSAYAYELETDDGPTEVGGYVECRALPGAKGVLVFTMISNITRFQTSYEEIQPMLNGIRLG